MDMKKQTSHGTQKADLVLKSNSLWRKINSWIEIQHMYIPSLRMHHQAISDRMAEGSEETPTHTISLFLPSDLPARVPCDIRLCDIEFQLRYAQCTDSLDGLHNALCLQAYVCIDKSHFQFGQHANMRMQSIINRIQEKVTRFTDQYRSAQKAIASLSPRLGKVGWEQVLLELRQEDVRTLNDDEALREKETQRKQKAGKHREGNPLSAVAEGHRTISWIWQQIGGEVEMDGDARLHKSKSWFIF